MMTGTSGRRALALGKSSRPLMPGMLISDRIKEAWCAQLDSRLSSSNERSRARQYNPDFGELAGLRIDLYRPRMLLDNDVVSDRQAKAGTFPGRFCREEGIEHLFPRFGRNARAVVANPDFNFVAEVF